MSDKLTAEDFRIAFEHAERVLKRFERIGGETLDTAINQLRYATRHFLDSGNEVDEDSARDHLKQAVLHCRRAEYDAVEAAIAVLGSRIVDFDIKYLEESVQTVIPNYADYYAKARKQLALLQEEDSPRNIDEDLTVYSRSLDDLVAFWTDISSKRPLVEKLDQEKRLAMKIATRRHLTNTLLAILAILVAVLGIVLAL